MFNLIQKITHNIVVTYMCTCAILSLIRDKHCKSYCKNSRHTENEKQSFKIVSRGGTNAEGTGGSIRTSRHSALREVADHSRCRKIFAVQSRERPPGRRRRCSSRSRSAGVEEDDLAGEQSRRRSPKTWLPATPEQVSRCKASGSGGLLSRALCAQRFGTGMDREQRDWNGKEWLVSRRYGRCLCVWNI